MAVPLALGSVERTSDRAPFRQIADQLRRAVDGGQLRAGDQIPSESELASHYGVTHMTVRNAVQELKTEGLLRSEQGRGVFVRDSPPIRRLAADRFARRHRDQGMSAFTAEAQGIGQPSVDNLAVDTVAPPDDVRRKLDLSPRARVIRRARRYLLDKMPVETAVSYVPLTLARGTAIARPNSGPGGIYARLEESGHQLQRFTEDVSARMPTEDERLSLQLAKGEPVLIVERTAYDIADLAVEVCHTVKAARSYILEYSFLAE